MASSVPFLFSVNERSAYVTGIGASLLIATLRVPSRLRWVAPALVMALLVMGSVGRIVAWAEAARVANGVRDAALARAGGARTVYLLASPDTVAGARSSPVSECYALLEPEAPLVLGSLRGESRSGVGPRVEGRRLVAPPGFRFTSQGCGEAEGALPPGIRATVECERGEPRSIEAIGNPAANTRLVAWEGQLRVRAFP